MASEFRLFAGLSFLNYLIFFILKDTFDIIADKKGVPLLTTVISQVYAKKDVMNKSDKLGPTLFVYHPELAAFGG